MGKRLFFIEDGMLKRIDKNAIKTIRVPDGVTSIEVDAFCDCTNLREVYIPASVERISSGVFEKCTKLEKIEISPDNPNFESKPTGGAIYSKDKWQIIPIAYKDNTTLDIPEGAVHLVTNYETFDDILGMGRAMAHYDRIIFPSTLEYLLPPFIMNDAKNVTEFIVHENNKNFAAKDGVLFTKNMNMLICYPKAREGAYRIPDTVTSISTTALRHCHKLTELYVPGTLKWFRAVIAYCSITAVHFEEGIETIEGYNFTNCGNIKEITLPSSVNLINGGCFNNCKSLKSITFLSKELYFAAEPTKGGVINKKKRPLYLPQIMSFNDCKNLESVSFPNLEQGYIPLDFLKSCPSLKYLRIGKYEIRSENGIDADDLVYNSGGELPFIRLCFIDSIINDKNYRSTVNAKPNVVVSVIAATDFTNDGEENAENYIKQNTSAVFERLIFSENFLLVKKLLDSGKFVSADNIEDITNSAIKHTQNGGSAEAQVMISRYAENLRSGLLSELEI